MALKVVKPEQIKITSEDDIFKDTEYFEAGFEIEIQIPSESELMAYQSAVEDTRKDLSVKEKYEKTKEDIALFGDFLFKNIKAWKGFEDEKGKALALNKNNFSLVLNSHFLLFFYIFINLDSYKKKLKNT